MIPGTDLPPPTLAGMSMEQAREYTKRLRAEQEAARKKAAKERQKQRGKTKKADTDLELGKKAKTAPAPQPKKKELTWEKPFLHESGQVWVYAGYGEWTLVDPNDFQAQWRLEFWANHPHEMRYYKERLEVYLMLKKAREEWEKSSLTPVLDCSTI